MSILIKGLEMPKDGETVTLTICADGLVFEEFKEPGDVFHAVPVPPHGRLGDLDALMKELEIDDSDDRTGAALLMAVFLEVLKSAPTIIPAEEG